MFERFIGLGRTFLGVALAGLGVLHYVHGEFIVGRAPAWPSSVAGGVAWAWVTGAFFILVGLALVTDRRVRTAALLAAVLVFLWALVRHVPYVATDHDFGSAWTNAGKALALTGGLLLAAGAGTASPSTSRLMRFLNSRRELEYAGRVALGLFLMSSGVQHFLFVPFVSSMVPSWVGSAVFWTYFAGVALIAGGLGMMIPPTAQLAGTLVGCMIFTWFLILHIPHAIGRVGDGHEWIAVCEALAMSGIAFMIAGFAHRRAAFRDPAVTA